MSEPTDRTLTRFLTRQQKRVRETLERYGRRVEPIDHRDSIFKTTIKGEPGDKPVGVPIPAKRQAP